MSEPVRPSTIADPRALAAALRVTARSRRVRVVVAFGLALVLTQLTRHADDRAAEMERAWEPAAEVWVATTPIEAGTLLTDANTAPRRLPSVALPTDAVTASPTGRRSAVALAEGEILRDDRLGGGGPIASQLHPDEGIVTLSADAAHLAPGDTVDLYALLTGDVVARRARVIEVDTGIAVVAVPRTVLSAVVRTFTTGDVIAVLVG